MMKNTIMGRIKNALCNACVISIGLVLFAKVSYGQEVVKMVSDPANGAVSEIQQHVTEIAKGINNPKNWKGITLEGDHPAVGLLNDLIDTEQIHSVRIAEKIHLLARNDDTYEVRDMYVKTANSDSLSYKSLVLQFDDDAELIDVRMSPYIHNVQLALDRKIEVFSEERTAVIKQVEKFQRALRNADNEKLETFLTEDAHLVKGDIARYYFDGRFGPYFKYSITDTEEFIEVMTNRREQKPQIQYDNIKVYRFPRLTDVYVATFYQQWKAGKYRDKGYIAMVIDLQNQPKIPLRVWKESAYETGSLEGEITPVADIVVPSIRTENNKQELVYDWSGKTTKEHPSGFLQANKQWLIMGAGASAAISAGAILLSGSSDSELPDPPGRPSIR